MDSAWIGLLGVVAGGLVGSLSSLLSPLVLWRTERKRLELEHKQTLELQTVQRKDEDAARRRALIQEWRGEVASLLARAKDSYNPETGQTSPEPPSPVDELWFQSLRPHIENFDNNFGYLTWSMSTFHEQTGRDLFAEITAIERRWGLG